MPYILYIYAGGHLRLFRYEILTKGKMMNENFEIIKRRHRSDAYIKSALISLSLGAFVFGAILLVFKLTELNFSIIYNVLIPIGVTALSLLVCLLLFLKSDMKIARMLDNEFSLAERVETMVQFRNETSDMLQIQRESTNKILSTLPTKKPVVVRFLSSGIAFILALGMLIPSLLVERSVTPPPVKEFLFTEWDEAFMLELKENIGKRKLDDATKSFMLAELDSLHTTLKAATTEEKMQNSIISSIVKLDLYADSLSTFKAICVAIDSAEYSDLKTIARLVLNLNGIAFGENLDDLKKNYEGDTTVKNEIDGTVTVITQNEKLTSLGEGLDEALQKIEGLNEDELYISLKGFATNIKATISESDPDLKAAAINNAFLAVSESAGKAISAQYAVRSAEDYITTSLIRHFNIPPHLIPPLLSDVLPELSTYDNPDGSGESDESSSSGGYGDGNELFGVSGVIYNPFGENGAEYIVLDPDTLDIYYERVEGILLDDNISLQIKQILADYYRKLSDGTNPSE